MAHSSTVFVTAKLKAFETDIPTVGTAEQQRWGNKSLHIIKKFTDVLFWKVVRKHKAKLKKHSKEILVNSCGPVLVGEQLLKSELFYY